MNLISPDRGEMRVFLLRRLARQGLWGDGHILEDNLLPSKHKDFAKETLEQLVKEGKVVAKPTSHGKAYHLNKQHRAEIMLEIGEGLQPGYKNLRILKRG